MRCTGTCIEINISNISNNGVTSERQRRREGEGEKQCVCVGYTNKTGKEKRGEKNEIRHVKKTDRRERTHSRGKQVGRVI